ncbi:MAG: 3-deoxy-manno-octulosonate cytidylyltransferase [Lewinellaceae bacterium]|jgi:3-deoxy-manno-octulosonate cytidylyltransferase (CMP-KDO synthetase)|nr:3-deoxy-manno-octulosonate cytidylyltransferase [Lewinellaceae bacterium]
MILAIIPARYASTRFPGKPLVDIGGKTMIQRVYDQVCLAGKVDRVVVATDDERIATHVRAFGGQALMTRVEHPSGTDRCAEVALQFPEAEWVLNVQGDEPFIQPQQIDLLAETLVRHPRHRIATLAKPVNDAEDLANPNLVKVVFSEIAGAIYFSRHPIPFVRGVEPAEWCSRHTFYRHIGLYGFERETLLELAALTPAPLERAESLEQLRWLEHGYGIAVGITEMETLGIDTPEDLLKINNL